MSKNRKHVTFSTIHDVQADQPHSLETIRTPKNSDMIRIFQDDLKYINEEGHEAKPGDPDPTDSLARSEYEYGSHRAQMIRMHTARTWDRRFRYLAEADLRYSLTPGRIRPDGRTTGSVPEPTRTLYENGNWYHFGPEQMAQIPSGGAGGRHLVNLGAVGGRPRNMDLSFNIRNRRPNFADIQVNGPARLMAAERSHGYARPRTEAENEIRADIRDFIAGGGTRGY